MKLKYRSALLTQFSEQEQNHLTEATVTLMALGFIDAAGKIYAAEKAMKMINPAVADEATSWLMGVAVALSCGYRKPGEKVSREKIFALANRILDAEDANREMKAIENLNDSQAASKGGDA